MNIYTRRHAATGVPIVPMLDILTILLIFFIVHTEFKRQNQVLPMTLPQTQHLSGERGDSDTLLLELDGTGRIALGGQIVPLEQLPTAVSRLRRSNPDLKIQVLAAEESSMGSFITIMDVLTAAGVDVEQVPVRIDYQPA